MNSSNGCRIHSSAHSTLFFHPTTHIRLRTPYPNPVLLKACKTLVKCESDFKASIAPQIEAAAAAAEAAACAADKAGCAAKAAAAKKKAEGGGRRRRRLMMDDADKKEAVPLLGVESCKQACQKAVDLAYGSGCLRIGERYAGTAGTPTFAEVCSQIDSVTHTHAPMGAVRLLPMQFPTTDKFKSASEFIRCANAPSSRRHAASDRSGAIALVLLTLLALVARPPV